MSSQWPNGIRTSFSKVSDVRRVKSQRRKCLQEPCSVKTENNVGFVAKKVSELK